MKSISIVSTRSYLDSNGSGTVPGNYTIWEARLNQYGFLDIEQPKPIKVNQNMEDLKKYRGKLYMIVNGHNLVRVEARECSECGKLSLIVEGLERCDQCYIGLV